MACGSFVGRTPKGLAIMRLARVAACLGIAMAGAAMAAGIDQGISISGQDADATLTFDIAPQPLMTALRTYSELTGQAVLVDASLTAGRQSPGVAGQYNKVDALRKLLVGTGLIASYSTDQSFTLKLAERTESANAISGEPEASDSAIDEGVEAVTQQYAGRIQRPIEAALCRSDLTRPGAYRLALQLWIAPSGKVERTHMLSGNDDSRANNVRQMLTGLVLDPPPSSMPQPLTLLLLPRNAAGIRDCGSRIPQHS